MAKGKSRKGKKEWRKNISAEEQEEFLQKLSNEERIGGPLNELSNENLFFVDTSKDEQTVKKVDRFRNKILHVDSVLKRNSLIPPVGPDVKKKPKIQIRGGGDLLKVSKDSNKIKSSRKKNGKKKSSLADIWDESAKNEEDDVSNLTFDDVLTEAKPQSAKKIFPSEKAHIPPPALEVDMPGCSFNPSFESHQDALAIAVAHEMQKVYSKELQPTSFPKFVSKTEAMLDEKDDLLLLEGMLDLNNEEQEEEQNEGEEEGTAPIFRAKKEKRLTTADKNRKIRRKLQEVELAARKEEKKRRRDVDRMKELLTEIKEKQDESEIKKLRRETLEEERRRELPPKLGPQKFEPEPVKVLLTEEVTGSLRLLKGCPTLSRDRFKSYQRRGLIEPRNLTTKKKKSSKKKYRIVEMGSRGRKEMEMQSEIEALRAERKEMETVAKEAKKRQMGAM